VDTTKRLGRRAGTGIDTQSSGEEFGLLRRFIDAGRVEDLAGTRRQAQIALHTLGEALLQERLAAMTPKQRYKLACINAGEHIPLRGDPEPTPCPEWCDEDAHLPERAGIQHNGASTDVIGVFSTAENRRTASTFAYGEKGQGFVYAGDEDLTPAQAREYADAIVRAADLAERIGADA